MTGGTASAADNDVVVLPIDPLAYDEPSAIKEMYGAPAPGKQNRAALPDRCGGAGPALPPEGEDVVVSISPGPTFTVGEIASSWWRTPPVTDVSWRLNFEGLMWMKPIAKRAQQDGRQDVLDLLVEQTVAFHAQNPDPNSNNWGWDEGTALRRLESENCLYALTEDSRLIPGMTTDANVNLGWRYYGPPNHSVHNHGLMANLQLVRAANMINKPAWKTTAINRMTSEAPQAFSNLGISYEQSSMYQDVNANLWEQGAEALEEAPGSENAAAQIRAKVAKAREAYGWMTEPDGVIVQIGDSDEDPGRVQDLGGNTRVLRDDQTGWIVGRWSWTDPNTNYYTLRYGPPRKAHGHHDNSGGVTWSSQGVRVLVGPGRFSYDKTNNYNAYQISPNSHNVALPSGLEVRGTTASITSAVVQGPAHSWSVKDKAFGIDHVRAVNVNRDTPHIRVKDTFTGSDQWRQYWHLDPQWVLTSGGSNSTQLVFTHPTGKRLTVTTNGRVSSIVKGITRPPQGWHFPQAGSRLQANEIVIRSYGGLCETTFVVS